MFENSFLILFGQNRPKGGVTHLKERYAKEHEPVDSLEDVVRAIKPNAVIGMQDPHTLETSGK